MLITTLEEALKSGVSSESIKPDFVAEEDVTYPAFVALRHRTNIVEAFLRNKGNTSEANQRAYQEIVDARKYGVRIINGKVCLTPVEPDTTLRFSGIEVGCLVHDGTLVGEQVDNLRNLVGYGVFGNPNKRTPTYLMKMGSCTIRSSIYGGRRVLLEVDKTKLMERRSILIDPEAINPDALIGDILGESYFVLGGIPREAIRKWKYL